MENFLQSRRQVLSFALSTGNIPKEEDHIKFFRSNHRSFWRLPNGQKHGHEEIYWGNGSIKISREWKRGKLEGLETLYDRRRERVRIRTNWKGGRMHGERSIFGLTFTTEQYWKEGVLVCSVSKSNGGNVTCKKFGHTEYIFRMERLAFIVDRKRDFLWEFGEDGSVHKHNSVE
ncbi:MORN repeat-containing protein [Brazilian marseillevirus]|uniref:MORN repeat-containing protein n=1 Tax=Brazilian marseillevirus TaxID=1813599 RepID=UPI0007861F8A|nr:MORN repeat-containing protein [Brazilian marseillevirus]AMQ10920.1 MORN repeat-containing protein [Brazilian marseillevirus]